MENQENDRIDKLQENLYSRESPPPQTDKRSMFSPTNYDVKNDWASEEVRGSIPANYGESKKGSFFSKLFTASVIFFVVALGIAFFLISGGFNAVSSKNVDISVLGLSSVDAGQELVLQIKVTNNNNVALENSKLSIEYPSGTRMVTDINTELPRQEEELGTINAGGDVSKTVHAVLFGEKESVKQIKISVEYKTKGSNALFYKDKVYEIAIRSSPVLMQINYPKEVNSNQDIDLNVEVGSNSNTLIKNLLFKADYPFGFTYTSATPNPSFGNNVWQVGDLSPKAKKTIVIHGKMQGQDEEEKTFQFHSGLASQTNDKNIGVDFITTLGSLSIRKPFISLDLKIDGDAADNHVTQIGETMSASISWLNNLPVNINDAVIQVKLSGAALDRLRISPENGGFYRSIDNTIIWDKKTVPELSQINPSEGGLLSFRFSSLPETSQIAAVAKNLEITLNTSISGTRIIGDTAPEQVSSSFLKKVKIGTELGLNSRILYSVGPFRNTGSLPPKAEKETTYTIIWTLGSTLNDVGGATVSATLPPYVRWLGNVSPATEKVSFNPDTNTVFWNAGDVKSGSGSVSTSKEVAFQVGFLPSLGQVGTTPIIINETKVTGTDKFTSKQLQSTKPSLSTRLSTDPIFETGKEVIVK
jgi:hypothetical protein